MSQVIALREWGNELNGRASGAVCGQALRAALANGDVIIDAAGVDAISRSFADEAIASIIAEVSGWEIKPRLSFRNVNEDAADVIRDVVANRRALAATN